MSTIEDRAARVYKNLIDEIDALYELAVAAGVSPAVASGHAHRAGGSALALKLDVTNALNSVKERGLNRPNIYD